MLVNEFKPRVTGFMGLQKCNDWTLKCYGISIIKKPLGKEMLIGIKKYLPGWLKNAGLTDLPVYKAGTLILHEGKEGCFAIICWWAGENMLQLFTYLARNEKPGIFELISDKGIVCCVWEMEVLWFERNAWVEEVMKQKDNPQALENYLNKHMNSIS